jgi:hypothetical protein
LALSENSWKWGIDRLSKAGCSEVKPG